MTGEKEAGEHSPALTFYKIYDARYQRTRLCPDRVHFGDWTFPVIGTDAVISKSGALREVFTDADTYCVDFGNRTRTPDERHPALCGCDQY